MEQLVKEALKGVKLIAGKCSWERAEKPHWEMEGLMRSMGRLEGDLEAVSPSMGG